MVQARVLVVEDEMIVAMFIEDLLEELGLIYAVRNQWRESQHEYQVALTGAAEADIRSGINDLEDAVAKRAGITAVRQAIDYLTTADRKALGFAE